MANQILFNLDDMKHILTLGIFLILVSCKSGGLKQGTGIDLLQHSTASEELFLSMLTDSVHLVALETTTESLIKSPKKIQVSCNCILVLSGNEILVFDRNGIFIRRIGTPGRGPGEFKFVGDFAVSEEGVIAILEGRPQVVYLYNLKGEQSKKFEVHPKSQSLFIHNGFIIVHNSNAELEEKISFEVFSMEGELLFTRNNFITYSGPKIGIYTFYSECNYFVLDGELYVKELHCDTVLRFSSEGFSTAFTLHTGDRAYLPQHRSDFKQNDIADYIYVQNMLAARGFVMIVFRYLRSGNIVILNNKEEFLKSYSFNNGIYDDLVTGRAIKSINQTGDGRIYYTLLAHEIVTGLGKGFNIEDISTRTGREINLDSNPIVAFFEPGKIGLHNN